VSNGDNTPPSTPTNLSASAAAYNIINLSWGASTDNVGVAGYYVIRNGVTIAQLTSTTYSDTSVNASTSYQYQVSAYDAKGNNSGLSTTTSVTTPAAPNTTPPSTPTGLSATAVSSSQINLSWGASTDNVGVAAYDVYRSGNRIASVTTTSFGDSGLSISTSYRYYVVARDASGNLSGPSSTVTAKTLTAINNGSVAGSVYSSAGGSVAYANVSLRVNRVSKTYNTNSFGAYNVASLPSGSYSLKFSKTGYRATTVSIRVPSGQTVTRNVTLQKH
jgi:chitodextrinase